MQDVIIKSTALSASYAPVYADDVTKIKRSLVTCARRYRSGWFFSGLLLTACAYIIFKKFIKPKYGLGKQLNADELESLFSIRRCISDIQEINDTVAHNIAWLEDRALPQVVGTCDRSTIAVMPALIGKKGSYDDQHAYLSDYVTDQIDHFKLLCDTYARRYKILLQEQTLESDEMIYRRAHEGKMRLLHTISSFIKKDYGRFQAQKFEVASELFSIALQAERLLLQ